MLFSKVLSISSSPTPSLYLPNIHINEFVYKTRVQITHPPITDVSTVVPTRLFDIDTVDSQLIKHLYFVTWKTWLEIYLKRSAPADPSLPIQLVQSITSIHRLFPFPMQISTYPSPFSPLLMFRLFCMSYVLCTLDMACVGA